MPATSPRSSILPSEVGKAFGGLDIVFVNAGIAVLKPIEQWSEADYDRSFAINVKGPFFLVQALLPLLGQPVIDRAEHLDQCPHRHAEFERLCGVQGCALDASSARCPASWSGAASASMR